MDPEVPWLDPIWAGRRWDWLSDASRDLLLLCAVAIVVSCIVYQLRYAAHHSATHADRQIAQLRRMLARLERRLARRGLIRARHGTLHQFA